MERKLLMIFEIDEPTFRRVVRTRKNPVAMAQISSENTILKRIFGILLILMFPFFIIQVVEKPSIWNILGVTFSGIAALCGILLLIIPEVRNWKRRNALKQPFDFVYEPVASICNMEVSPKLQEIQITIKARTEVTVERIGIRFEGLGKTPTIEGLYDWNLGKIPPHIIVPFSASDGTWYWDYVSPLRRPKTGRIKIGLRLLATGHFDGHLKLWISITEQPEGYIQLGLPLKVKETTL